MSGKVSFLGLGSMGFGMATVLIRRGFSVTGFDIYEPTLRRFVEVGGKAASTPKETVKDAQYIVFMVATAAQILEAVFDEKVGAIHSLPHKSVLILCSTGPPEHAPKLRELLDGKFGRGDVEVVDAPVSGGTIRAANGTLTILAAGSEGALEAARPVLEAMAGENLYIIPGGLGAGTKVKIVHQVLAGIHITMASEAIGFAAKMGLDTRVAFDAARKSQGSSWMFENRVPHMLKNDLTPLSALNIIVKDVGIVTAVGRSEHFPLFLTSAAEQVLATGVSAGYGLEDDSGLVRVYLPQEPTLVFKQGTASESGSEATTEHDPKVKMMVQMMAGVHLAAAAEAMSLGVKVGLEPGQLFEIISTAAGTSWMFADRVPQILSGKWDSGRKTVDVVMAELTEAMEEANRLKYPLPLAGTALQLFQLAATRGSAKDADVAVVGVWDGAEGAPLFPRVRASATGESQ